MRLLERQGESMKLTVLGSGITVSPPGTQYRYPATHLVETNGATVLLDAGLGALPQLYSLGKTLEDIDAICITHFHADHFNMSPILQALFVHYRQGETRRKLKMYGPAGIKKRMEQAFALNEFEWATLEAVIDIEIVEYESGTSIDVDADLQLTPIATTHFALDAYALRLKSQGRILTYSGDTTDCDGIRKAAKGADLFLCEAANDLDEPKTTDGHVNAVGAAKIAQAEDVKQLVITHYTGRDTEVAMLDAAQNEFAGSITIAHDIELFEI